MDRRTLLRLLGVTTAAGLAGCASQESDAEGTSPTETPSTTERSPNTSMNDSSETTDATGTEPTNAGLVTVPGGESVEATVERIEGDIESSPLTLVTTVDHAKNAASVDRTLPPTTLLIFGNPEIGTPLMQASRTVAIDLPQKMLVWEDGDRVKVTYNDPAYLARRHGIEGQGDRLEQIATALEGLATSGN